MSVLCRERNEFHKPGLLFAVNCSKSARNEESSSRDALNSGLTSADSGLQVNLEIALSGVSAKVKPPTGFQPARKCVEASDDVIKRDFTTTPDSRILDFSPTPRIGEGDKETLRCDEVYNMIRFPTRICLTYFF